MSASDAEVPADGGPYTELAAYLLATGRAVEGAPTDWEAVARTLGAQVERLRPIEQRAREVVGTLQPEDTKSLAARGRTRVNLARWILGESS